MNRAFWLLCLSKLDDATLLHCFVVDMFFTCSQVLFLVKDCLVHQNQREMFILFWRSRFVDLFLSSLLCIDRGCLQAYCRHFSSPFGLLRHKNRLRRLANRFVAVLFEENHMQLLGITSLPLLQCHPECPRVNDESRRHEQQGGRNLCHDIRRTESERDQTDVPPLRWSSPSQSGFDDE